MFLSLINSQAPCYNCKTPLRRIIYQSHLSFLELVSEPNVFLLLADWSLPMLATQLVSLHHWLWIPFASFLQWNPCFPNPVFSVFVYFLVWPSTSFNRFLRNGARKVKFLRPCMSRNTFSLPSAWLIVWLDI